MDPKAKADEALTILDAFADRWAARCDLTAAIKDLVSPMQLKPTVARKVRAQLTHRMEVLIDGLVKGAYKAGAYEAIIGMQDARRAKRRRRHAARAAESQTESQTKRSEPSGERASR